MNFKKQYPILESGFTLMEILVTLAIFSTALVIIANIFVLSSRAQQKTSTIEKVQSDARFSMESMVREVRAGSIDYLRYGGAVGLTSAPVEELNILDVAGRHLSFFKSACDTPEERQCLKVSLEENGEETIADVTNAYAKVSDLKFYISPLSDPFMPPPENVGDCFNGNLHMYNPDEENLILKNNVCLCGDDTECYPDQFCIDTGKFIVGNPIKVCKNADIQPHVTIILVTDSASSDPREQTTVSLQTTVSTKNYER